MPGAGTVRSAQLRTRCFAALSLAGALWLLASVSAAASNGSCGTARAHGGPNGQLVDVRITVLVGPASCHTARKVLADSIDSHAGFQGHGATAHRTIDGWRCYRPSLGYAGCTLGSRTILGRYSPAGCAPGYDRALPAAAGGPRYHDAINLLTASHLTCTQAAGLAQKFDVPYYAHKTRHRNIATSLGTFSCQTSSRAKNTLQGTCTLQMRRVSWSSQLQ